MGAKNFVAFDLGAESGRAVLGELDEGKLTLSEKHRFANPTSRVNGHLHWNILAQWEELKTGLRKAAGATADSRGRKLDGIGVDTWGVDYGLIARGGELIGNPYHYRDRRTDGMMDRAFAKVPREKIFEATGLQFMQINTLFQLMAAAQQEPEILQAAEKMLFVPDLFNYFFSGVARNEFSIVSTSQMFNPVRKDWAGDLLEQLGLPTHLLCEIVPCGTKLGTLRPDVAEECSVAADTPLIAPATHDTASAVAAVPAQPDTSWCFISSGTWSLMGVELDHPVINDKSLKYNYTNEGGVGGSTRFLKNIMGLWLVQECRRHWIREGHDHSYAELTEMAARAKGLLALLDLDYAPLALPGNMPQKIAQFCRQTNQTIPQTRGEYVRACLDGLALTYRRSLKGLEDVLGRRIDVIHIVGGGVQNGLLNQMTADACNRPVVAGPIEATAIGNILVQAMATGDVRTIADARQIVSQSFDVKRYEPTDTAAWDRADAKFRELRKV
jgi:sugar (pentulose or hexulose) kinase